MRATKVLSAVATAIVTTGVLVVLSTGPAYAATAYCTYNHNGSDTNAILANNYGYSPYGYCYRVQARAKLWVDSTYSFWSYGPLAGQNSQSAVLRGSYYNMTSEATNGQPTSGGPWASWYSCACNTNRSVSVTV
jgi:hypothetical protein